MKKFYLLTVFINLLFLNAFSQGTTIQTITFDVIASKSISSPAFTINAVAQSGLPVSFAVTTGASIASVSGSTVTLSGTAAGSVTITATQAGDVNFAAATPVTRTFTVTKLAQTITFATIPAKYLNSADFAISASASSALALTYAISGPATLTGTTVHLTGSTGTVTITASQAGNGAYNAATSVARSFTVSKVAQTITFATLTNKLINSPDFTLTATASSGLAVSYAVTGPATIVGSAVHLTGVAGTVVITASQAGNSTYNAATNLSRTFTVNNLATQTITFAAIPAKYTNSPDITLGATSTSGLAVSYAITGPATLSGSVVQLTGSAGTVSITASQAGNTSFQAATSVTNTFTVSQVAQVITFAAIANKIITDADFTIAATASSGLAVSYAITGPASLTGSTVHLTGTGTVTITASQAGNASFSAATSVVKTFTVSKASQTITFAALSNKFTNSADFTIGGTSSAGLTVTYAISGPATLTGTLVHLTGLTGTVTITASQVGNAAYNAATDVVRTFTVGNLGTQTITFATIANKYVNSAAITLAATASSGLAVSYAITGPATLSGSVVTLTGAVGTVSITASQAGNASYSAAASVVRTFTVSKVAQTITFGTLANKLKTAADFSISATSSSALAVTFTISGPATLTGTTVHLTGLTGTVTITAAQAGNATYSAATSVVRTFSVTDLTAQTITFATIANKLVNAADFTLAATSSSGLTVSYAITGPATLTGSLVHITGAGTVNITASQAGNTTYLAATSITRSFTVTKLTQTITWAAITSKVVGDADFSVSATASSGLTTTYSVVAGPAIITAGTVHLTGVSGNVTLRATQAGDATYSAKTQDVLFTVAASRSAAPTPLLENNNAIGFYPNPSKDNIQLMNLTEDAKISIIDLQGNVKLFDNINSAESLNRSIDLSGLNKGTYYIRIESGKRSTQQLLIKE